MAEQNEITIILVKLVIFPATILAAKLSMCLSEAYSEHLQALISTRQFAKCPCLDNICSL